MRGWGAAAALASMLAGGCTIEQGALGPPDGGEAMGADASSPGDGPADDGSDVPPDAGTDGDAGLTVDAGQGPCLPSPERCNGRDDDCDGTVDEGACSGCMVSEISETTHVFCVEALSWAEARSWCRDQGLDLMVVDDLDEDRAAHDQARLLRARAWWMGLEDRAAEGTYVWVDGRTAWEDGTARTFTNFAGGRPSERPPDDCVQTDASASDGIWIEARCDDPAPFVCEARRPGGEREDDEPKSPEPDLEPSAGF